MTSKIKVDNINKVSDDSNIINKCGTTITLGASGDSIALASGASQSGFGRTGTVDWNTTPKTATFTAVSGDGFFANTTGSAFNMNLPAGSAGDIVSVADYAGTWQTNALIVVPNGTDKIGGVNANVVLNTEGQSVTFIFVDSTQGWINTMDSTSNERANPFLVATGGTITTSGNCKIHTFTGPGTFTVCSVSTNCAAENVVSYTVLAGGASGGNGIAGGGGAGGFREVKSPLTPYTASPLDGYPSAPNRVTVTATAFPITVGAGGAQNSSPGNIRGLPGSVSTFSTITSAGGGAGSGYSSSSETGGSGGGGSGGGPAASGAAGNTPPTTPSQGSSGGNGAPGNNRGGGGGGGATGAGGSTTDNGANGGTGATTSINATPTARAGGGGGGNDGPAVSTGGTGGGGNGGTGGACNAVAGTVNTGSGGGGGGPGYKGGAGGSGIVIIRYKFK